MQLDDFMLPDFIRQILNLTPPSLACGGQIGTETTPVLAFGDFDKAKVATLGINPSSAEFYRKVGTRYTLLSGDERRLATSESLGPNTEAVSERYSDAQKLKIVDDCKLYFQRRPYKGWFNPLNDILKETTSCDYQTGTACHIDLFPWATHPVWNGLSSNSQKMLIEAGKSYLTALLKHRKFEVILINGRTAYEAVQEHFHRPLESVLTSETPGQGNRLEFFAGRLLDTHVIAWSVNIQSAREARKPLVEFIAKEVSILLSDAQSSSSSA